MAVVLGQYLVRIVACGAIGRCGMLEKPLEGMWMAAADTLETVVILQGKSHFLHSFC